MKKKEIEAMKHSTQAQKLAELNEELRNLFNEERKTTATEFEKLEEELG